MAVAFSKLLKSLVIERKGMVEKHRYGAKKPPFKIRAVPQLYWGCRLR